jgi:hypothetical protein
MRSYDSTNPATVISTEIAAFNTTIETAVKTAGCFAFEISIKATDLSAAK